MSRLGRQSRVRGSPGNAKATGECGAQPAARSATQRVAARWSFDTHHVKAQVHS